MNTPPFAITEIGRLWVFLAPASTAPTLILGSEPASCEMCGAPATCTLAGAPRCGIHNQPGKDTPVPANLSTARYYLEEAQQGRNELENLGLALKIVLNHLEEKQGCGDFTDQQKATIRRIARDVMRAGEK